jgi:hypothetical protein
VKQCARLLPIAATILCLQAHAAAEEQARRQTEVRARLEYRAPPECPDAAQFRTLVGSRLPEGWEAGSGALAGSFEVEVSAAQSGYVATLVLLDERGQRVSRTVGGDLCASVADAIALVTALAIQSRAAAAPTHAEPAPAPAAEPVLTPPAANATATKEPATRSAAMTRRARTTRGRAAEKLASAPAAQQPSLPATDNTREATHLRVSGRAALSTGVGPNVAPGAALGLVVELRRARHGAALHA